MQSCIFPDWQTRAHSCGRTQSAPRVRRGALRRGPARCSRSGVSTTAGAFWPGSRPPKSPDGTGGQPVINIASSPSELPTTINVNLTGAVRYVALMTSGRVYLDQGEYDRAKAVLIRADYPTTRRFRPRWLISVTCSVLPTLTASISTTTSRFPGSPSSLKWNHYQSRR